MDELDTDKRVRTGSTSFTKKRELLNRTASGSGRESSLGLSNKSFNMGMISASSRPVTQQGMTGLQSHQTVHSGLNRQYHDKRYYISAIQNHMLSIIEEINRLKKSLGENKLHATNHEECKKQVDQLSKQLAEYEETLIVYNTAIETSMMKGSRSDIDADTEKLRQSNQHKIEQLEALFSNKIKLEDQLQKLQEQAEEDAQMFNEMLESLPEEKREEYYKLKEANETYKSEETYLNNEIKELRKVINVHEQYIMNNEPKRLRYNLLVKLYELNNKRDKLLEENKIKRTPSQEREYLLEQVKQDRADIEIFKAQKEEMSAELKMLKEREMELDDELSEKNSARLNKYRELLKRQETMETFLGSFDEVYAEEVNKLKEIRSSVVFCLEYTSGNMFDVNFDDIDANKKYLFNTNSTSKDELTREHKKLAAQLNVIKSVNTRFEQEIATLKTKQKTYQEELKVFQNIDQSRDTLLNQKKTLDAQKESLQGVLEATRSAVAEAEKKKIDLETELKFNDAYNAINELEERLENLTNETEQLKEELDSVKMMDNYDQISKDSMNLVKEILGNAQRKLSKKKIKT